MTRAAVNIALRVERLPHAPAPRGVRHELHESESSLRRNGAGIEARLGVDDGLDEARIETMLGSGVFDGVVVTLPEDLSARASSPAPASIDRKAGTLRR